jgi:small subunit ribosomal protein S17
VLVERRVKHPIYGKYIKRSNKIHAHDPENVCQEGDLVTIEETKPISKSKAWKLSSVDRKATII